MSYECQVSMKKYFVSGLLEGLTVDDKMGFLSWEDACIYAAQVTESSKVNFVVLEMMDLHTGIIEKF